MQSLELSTHHQSARTSTLRAKSKYWPSTRKSVDDLRDQSTDCQPGAGRPSARPARKYIARRTKLGAPCNSHPQQFREQCSYNSAASGSNIRSRAPIGAATSNPAAHSSAARTNPTSHRRSNTNPASDPRTASGSKRYAFNASAYRCSRNSKRVAARCNPSRCPASQCVIHPARTGKHATTAGRAKNANGNRNIASRHQG